MDQLRYTPEIPNTEQDRIVIIGAGGFTGEKLYTRNLLEMGIPEDQLVLVDTSEEHLDATRNRHPNAQTYLDSDQAFEEVTEQGNNISTIIIASSTAAHADNIKSIINAAEEGKIDLATTKIWCEKPLTPPEIFDEICELAENYPDLDISVGYILRFSEILSNLRTYLEENDLNIEGIEWTYGKDRSTDTRLTQGVFPDEVVHPLSVTDLILTRAFGDTLGVDINSANIQRLPFANPAVQEKANAENPSIPLNPTSDVQAELHYSFHNDGSVTQIPVSINSSFRFEKSVRQAKIYVTGPEGSDTLVLEFDTATPVPGGKPRRTDTLTRGDGSLLYEWDGDKAAAQLNQLFLTARGGFSETSTSLEGETRIQKTLRAIGNVALSSDY